MGDGNTADIGSLTLQLLGVLSQMETGLIAFDSRGKVIFCTPFAVGLLGKKPNDIESFVDGLSCSETTRSLVRQSIEAAAQEKHELDVYLDERLFRLTAMRLDGDPPVRAVLLSDHSRDQAERRRMERLERLATLGQITVGAAHEFNNSLTSVIGWNQIAMQNTPSNSPAAAALSIIDDNAQKAKRIFAKLLDMSKSPSDAGERRFVLPEDVLEESLEILKFELDSANVTVTRRLQPTTPCYLDVDGLGQVIINIVRNSIDAMQGGGALEVAMRMDAEALRISFKDTGPGMAPDVAAHIFDSFFTTKRDSDVPLHGGTGLGLSISRNIIRRMGGDITVQSAEGAGSTFDIVLPRDAVQGGTEAEELPSRATRPTIPPGAVVLVVDDEPDIGEMIRMALGLQGVSVISVNSGDQAISQLNQVDFDAAFVDYTMPGLSGHELGEEMRRLQPSLPIVFMSGLTVEIDRVVGDFIKKPFDLDEIQSKLYAVLKRRKEALLGNAE